ncbi:carbonic anhydrase 4-like [Cololabis saira]|uniref:carbonic anhydrase 4-like n=1 Tax=Cololabis saira TaxID=129043 RepID=UPI002AD2D365|nr:carbonic anhydrase 4-like [Cololabis saira]
MYRGSRMYLVSLVLCLALSALVRCTSDWCYKGCEHTPSHWKDMHGNVCGGTKQSPINIHTSSVKTNSDLHNFTLTNFTSEQAVKSILFNGHAVKCILKDGEIEVSGGGLNGTYSALQFHFHWGQTDYTTHPGSEHTVDGHRYPMEMHIVTVKKGLSVSEATQKPDGLAVLGFFINATEEFEDAKMSEQWTHLTDYLPEIIAKPDGVPVTKNISIEKLIGHVNLTKFYRYMGSLTTPNCNESVVWTVFHEPIQVKKDLIPKFPSLTNKPDVYRPSQDLHGRQVYASPATPLPSHSWCYDDHCEHSPSHWVLLADSHCGGQRQSPIDIDTHDVTLNESLGPFTFTKFDDKHAIKYITNTGHSVKCVLKDDLVEVSGGGLGHVYSTLQFHFHWGSGSGDSKGSEHTMDTKRYPMEMHIVNKRKDLTLAEALKVHDGLAVLGFFIEAPLSSKSGSHGSEDHAATNPTSSPSSNMDAWKKFTQYLSVVESINSKAVFTDEISIDDLLGNVNRRSYFRYNGSLTTPTCNEAVVWTVFKESVKVDPYLMSTFPTHTGYRDVFRPSQSRHSRVIFTTKSASSVSGPVMFYQLLACLCALLR